MKEDDYLLLVTIYESQNITKAAEKLFLSQPTLSYRLRQIETEFGIKIIVKDGKKLRFTPEGEYLVEFAKKMLGELNILKTSIQAIKDQALGFLEVGVSSNFALYKLPTLLQNFFETYPNIQINVKSGWSSEILQMVEKNDIQVGIVTGDYDWSDGKHLINRDPVTLISKNPIDFEKLPNIPRINYRPKSMYKASLELKDPITRLVEYWWKDKFRIKPYITMQVDKVETCKEMVKRGLGYSIIPYSCLTEEDFFYTYHLEKDSGLITRDTWLLYRKNSLQMTAVNTFVDYLKAIFREEI